MKTTKIILALLEEYLEKNPDQRFTQALFNLNINEFADPKDPGNKNHLLRDIYNDKDDKVLERISNSLSL